MFQPVGLHQGSNNHVVPPNVLYITATAQMMTYQLRQYKIMNQLIIISKVTQHTKTDTHIHHIHIIALTNTTLVTKAQKKPLLPMKI